MMTIEKFSRVRVLCVGDVMLDRFVHGAVDRVSPESPVPVLRVTGTQDIVGGAANVGRNVAALDGQCTLVGVVGADAAGARIASLLQDDARLQHRLVTDAARCTTEKTRFVAQGQHLLRADHEILQPVAATIEAAVIDAVRRELPAHDVLVLSDYAKGVLTDTVIATVVALAKAQGKPVVVDPKSADLARYQGATIITPNRKETLAATGIDPVEDADAEQAALAALRLAGAESILVTRAERGMSLLERNGSALHIPAQARDVFDVVGAGDTVVATLALALGGGFTAADAAALANTAAGIVVSKPGTATLTQSELMEALAVPARAGAVSTGFKVLGWQEAGVKSAAWRRDALRVGFTNGCFDILHAGHIGILEFARSQCDRLIVGLNSDDSVRRLKGPQRPLNAQDNRAKVLAALGVVDAVVVFDQDTPAELIHHLAPELLVKGADYQVSEIVGADEVLANGGRVLTFELVPEISTTRIAEKAAQGGKQT